jgi:hypothetical protein
MKFKRFMRLTMLIIVIAMAAALPVPMKFAYKDELPQNLQEQVDKKEEDEEDNEQNLIM